MGSGKGKTKRVQASVAPTPEAHQVVPGEHKLVEDVQWSGLARLRSREAAYRTLTYLVHELRIPRGDDDARSGVVDFWGNSHKSDPAAPTRFYTSFSNICTYSFEPEDLVAALKEITGRAAEYPRHNGQYAILQIGVPPDNDDDEYAALTYVPPEKKGKQGAIVFSRAGDSEEAFSGTLHVSRGEQGYLVGTFPVSEEEQDHSEVNHEVLGVFALRDAVAAVELLETMPALEHEFEETQKQRWQDYRSSIAPMRVPSVDAKKVVF